MAPHRIAVIGSTGQLGSDLVEVLGQNDAFDVMPLSHADCDCTKPDQVRAVLHRLHPEIVVNCAAYIRVDDCEDHTREAFEVNAIGALTIARSCDELRAFCVYVSTDYVFAGTKTTPYVESDPTCPVNVYGVSKLAGEHLVRQAASNWLIVRMASLFGKTGARGKLGNFVETIVAKANASEPLKLVNDVRMSPTYTRDAAVALVNLIEARIYGIVHLTNDGGCTWYEFAKHALGVARISAAIEPVSSEEYSMRARRPKNSVLHSERSPHMLRSWQDALKAYLIEKGHVPKEANRRKAGSGRPSSVSDR